MLSPFDDVTGSLHQDTARFSISIKLIALLCLLFSFSAVAEKLFHFDIEQQSADKALISFATRTDKTLIFSYELVKNYQANALNGYFTIEHGLSRLLRNTGLSASFNNDNEITIQRQALTQSIPAPSQQSIPQENSKSPSSQVEKIAVVGSREIARSIQELSVPVDILSHDALFHSGQLENGRMLQTVAPSFNFPSSSISDGTDVLKPATLRGLGPDQTLILVNGKRRHHASLLHINTSVGRGTSGADLNAIPFSAIKRIEILRDGAAAQYGSDAIAGVINIVLKDSDTQGLLNSTYGLYSMGDGQSIDASVNKGFSLNDNGFFNATFSVQDHQATNRSGVDASCQFSGCVQLSDGLFLSDNPDELNANRDTFEIGDPAFQYFALAYNSRYRIGLGELYSFAIHSRRENDSAAFFRSNNNQAANPILSDGNALIPNGYLPYIHSDIIDSSFNIGYKTPLDDNITFDISYTYGNNTIEYTTKNSVNASYAQMLAQQQVSAAQIRQDIPRTADAYDLSLSLQTLNIDIQQSYDALNLSMGLELRQDSYQVLPGEQYSYVNYIEITNEQSVTSNSLGGIQGFPGIAPDSAVDEQRNVASLYVELNGELMESVNYAAAVRYDNYQGFGDTSNIKLAANWRASDNLRLRSSISTGFRAPSMQQLYFNNVSSQFIVDDNNQLNAEQVGTFRNDSLLARSVGIPQLQEEQSSNFSLGGVFDFSDHWNMTVDYYAIKIDDRIVISNKLSPEFSASLALAISNENVDKAQVFLNGANTKTTGIDIISSWKNQAFNGDLALVLAANFTKTQVTSLYSPNDSELHSLDIKQVFAEQDISIIEQWQPRSRISFSSHYQQNDWSLNLAINRYGEYTITDGEKQGYGAKILTDIRFEHQLTKQVVWYAGVNNLFNVMPDINTIGNANGGIIVDLQGNTIVSSPGVFKYSRRSAPFGFNGSYGYLGINYHF